MDTKSEKLEVFRHHCQMSLFFILPQTSSTDSVQLIYPSLATESTKEMHSTAIEVLAIRPGYLSCCTGRWLRCLPSKSITPQLLMLCFHLHLLAISRQTS